MCRSGSKAPPFLQNIYSLSLICDFRASTLNATNPLASRSAQPGQAHPGHGRPKPAREATAKALSEAKEVAAVAMNTVAGEYAAALSRQEQQAA